MLFVLRGCDNFAKIFNCVITKCLYLTLNDIFVDLMVMFLKIHSI